MKRQADLVAVEQDYVEYQIWDTLQAFCSTVMGTLATKALLTSMGVGNQVYGVKMFDVLYGSVRPQDAAPPRRHVRSVRVLHGLIECLGAGRGSHCSIVADDNTPQCRKDCTYCFHCLQGHGP